MKIEYGIDEILLSQAVAKDFFSERDQALIEAYRGSMEYYRMMNGYPQVPADYDSEPDLPFISLSVRELEIIGRWILKSDDIITSGDDGEITPFNSQHFSR